MKGLLELMRGQPQVIRVGYIALDPDPRNEPGQHPVMGQSWSADGPEHGWVALSPEKAPTDRWPIDLWCVRWLGREIEPLEGSAPWLTRVRVDRMTLFRRERPEQVFGPNGAAVVALIERVSRLTLAEVADPGSVFEGRADLGATSSHPDHAEQNALACVRHTILARAEEIVPHAVGNIERSGGTYGAECSVFSRRRQVMAEKSALDAARSIIADGAVGASPARQT
jgi:hypothetical protein